MNFLRILVLGLFAIGIECNKYNARKHVNNSFAAFKSAFGRTYSEGTSEHEVREKLFNARIAEINAHNAKGRTWKMGVNHFTDRTEDELKHSRGYKKTTLEARELPWSGSSMLELGDLESGNDKACMSTDMSCTNSACCSGLVCGAQGVCQTVAAISETVDYTQLKTSSHILDQGACGSCWAVAAAAAIQLAAAKANPGFDAVLSPQSILSCTPNKMECGGKGGCDGATPELGFEYVKNQGRLGGVLPLDHEQYTATTNGVQCEAAKKESFLQTKPRAASIPAVSIGGWVKVEANNGAKVMQSLSQVGPLAVSVAGSNIQGYSEGVIDTCHGNMVVDHAVVMMGYGNDPEFGKYWRIRNSWGKHWGEQGYFRLRRHADGGKTEEPCGWDEKPEVGVVCKDAQGNYPKRTWVCGECGIVNEVSYPVGVQVHPAMLM
jgi:cathepsin L